MKHWTKTEINVVANCVRENPHNLQEAFKKAEKIIGRTFDAISFKYHSYIKQKLDMFNITPQSRTVNKLDKVFEDNYNVKNKMNKKDEVVIESFKEVCSVYTDVVMRVGNKQIKAAKATICTVG